MSPLMALFAHPILPLISATDPAIIDRKEASHPPFFHRPEDARAQVVQIFE